MEVVLPEANDTNLRSTRSRGSLVSGLAGRIGSARHVSRMAEIIAMFRDFSRHCPNTKYEDPVGGGADWISAYTLAVGDVNRLCET